MTIRDVHNLLLPWAPLHYAEEFDNVGLLVGNWQESVQGILVTLDTTESLLDEAIELGCNLIISFHPIIFKGLKKLDNSNYVERIVAKAIQNRIAIYAIHTALDNAWTGVNHQICNKLGLVNRSVLIPQKNTLKKLVTYAPVSEATKLLEAVFAAGAGSIGNYQDCSFSAIGTGTFRATSQCNPSIGKIGERHSEEEKQIHCIFPKHKEREVVQALLETHSYEEVAYEIFPIENTHQQIGMGMIGALETAVDEVEFLNNLKKIFKSPCIRHSSLRNRPIHRVAVLGGSGGFAIANAKQSKVDVFVTSDLKYHQFFEADNQILLVDIGHYESEQFTKELIVSYLRKKILNFAPDYPIDNLFLSNTRTNPVHYFT